MSFYDHVVNQRSDYAPASQEGNAIHVLAIAAGGRLSEPGPAVHLPVPPTARPQRIVVL